MTHKLKTWPVYFNRILSREKTFEVRKNDRDFQSWDSVLLAEYDPNLDCFTGREIYAEISYVLNNFDAIKPGFVVFGLKNISDNQEYSNS